MANADNSLTLTTWEDRWFIHIILHMQDVDEDDLGYDLFNENNSAEAKWDHWPTNALMKDKITFDMAFELLQNRVP